MVFFLIIVLFEYNSIKGRKAQKLNSNIYKASEKQKFVNVYIHNFLIF